MQIATGQHLTYCLNIHPGETWEEAFAAIREHVPVVKQRIAPDRPFGLGLRLGNRAVQALRAPAARNGFREWLSGAGCYVFTVNAFPYGAFHGRPVKEQVYQPDWRTAARREYTNGVADVLCDLLPEGGEGSISTVPGSFKPWIIRPDDTIRLVEKLCDAVLHLARIRDRTGHDIHLGLEPEPGCFLETTDEVIRFYHEQLLSRGVPYLRRRAGLSDADAEAWIRTHLGICVDTCHVAIQFEDLVHTLSEYASEEIRVSKIQLSAALEVFNDRTQIEALHPFVEPVYLHQVKAQTRHGALRSWTDLPEALRQVKDQREYERLRIHFHVPLDWTGSSRLGTTAALLDDAFFEAVRSSGCRHLEVETYTFDVLPPELARGGVDTCIVNELKWARDRLEAST